MPYHEAGFTIVVKSPKFDEMLDLLKAQNFCDRRCKDTYSKAGNAAAMTALGLTGLDSGMLPLLVLLVQEHQMAKQMLPYSHMEQLHGTVKLE